MGAPREKELFYRRYRVKAGGCLVREAVGLESTEVGEVEGGEVVTAAGDVETTPSAQGNALTRRVRIVQGPKVGWVSEKRLEAYGTWDAGSPPPREDVPPPPEKTLRLQRLNEDKTEEYEAFCRERRLDPSGVPGRLAYARALVSTDLEEAERRVRRVLYDFPNDVAATKVLEDVLREKNKPPTAAGLRRMADAHFTKRNWRSAATLYETLAVARQGGGGQTLPLSAREGKTDPVGDFFLEQPPPLSKMATTTTTPPMESSHTPKKKDDGSDAARLWANASACYSALKKWDDAERCAARAVTLDASWPKARRRLAAALLGKGRALAADAELRLALSASTDEKETREIAKQRRTSEALFRRAEVKAMAFEDDHAFLRRELDFRATAEREACYLGKANVHDVVNAPEPVKANVRQKRRAERRATTARLFMTRAQRVRLRATRDAATRSETKKPFDFATEDDGWPFAPDDPDDDEAYAKEHSDLESSDFSAGDYSSSDDESDRAKKDRDDAKEAFRRAAIDLERQRVDRLRDAVGPFGGRTADGASFRWLLPPGGSSSSAMSISTDGAAVKQRSALSGGMVVSSVPLPKTGVTAWCVSLESAGQPSFGVVSAGFSGSPPVTASSETKDAAWWLSLRGARHSMAKFAKGKDHGDVPGFGDVRDFDVFGFVFDADAKTMDAFKNGHFVARLFDAADFFLEREAAPSDDSSESPPSSASSDPSSSASSSYYPAVAVAANAVGVAECRLRWDVVDEEEVRLAKVAARSRKTYRLAREDGSPHPRRLRRRGAFRGAEVHEDKGPPDVVWIETEQARWTQSVEKVEVIALLKKADVPAADLDVKIAVRYLKVRHRVTRDVYLEGELHRDVHPEESLWFVDDDGVLRLVLAKSAAQLHAKDAHVADARWFGLFAFDDPIEEDDMEHDRTDLDPALKRTLKLVRKKASEDAALEAAKRAQCDKDGTNWTWVHHDDRDPTDYPVHTIEPSYTVPGELGYDAPIDRSLVLRREGFITGA